MAIHRGIPDDASLGGLKDGMGGNKVNAYLGSEALVNNAIQAGSITIGTNAGSAWAIFGKPFTNAPVVVASIGSGVFTRANAGAGSLFLSIQNINTGSAQIICQCGSGAVGFTDGPVLNWIAFGTY